MDNDLTDPAVRFKRLAHSSPHNVCPFLGIYNDADMHARYPTGRNRCYCSGRGEHLSNRTQRELCLTVLHPQCERYTGRSPGDGR